MIAARGAEHDALLLSCARPRSPVRPLRVRRAPIAVVVGVPPAGRPDAAADRASRAGQALAVVRRRALRPVADAGPSREALVVILAEYDYAPLPGQPPLIVPSMTSSCSFSRALAFLSAPSALRGRCRVFPMNPEGGAPQNWKKKASDKESAMRAWLRTNPDADLSARTGCGTGLVIVQVADADALAAAEMAFGRLPTDTVRSLSRSGLARWWMRIPATVRTMPTQLSLAPGVRLLADGAFARLPDAGLWTTAPDHPDADFQPLPQGWAAAAVAQAGPPPTPNVRIFTRH